MYILFPENFLFFFLPYLEISLCKVVVDSYKEKSDLTSYCQIFSLVYEL